MIARMISTVVALAMVSAGLSANEPRSKAPAEAPGTQVEEVKESCPSGQAGAVVHSRTYVTVGNGQLEQKIYSPWNTITSCMPIDNNLIDADLTNRCLVMLEDAIRFELKGDDALKMDKDSITALLHLRNSYYSNSLLIYAKRQALGCPNITFEQLKSAYSSAEAAIKADLK